MLSGVESQSSQSSFDISAVLLIVHVAQDSIFNLIINSTVCHTDKFCIP